ncbi:MAG TPA: hypothetical protein VNV88_07670, partial [Candidatus Solibacter sp.]|nr:hypothetical protein [Candidatus Solibacter sp.]
MATKTKTDKASNHKNPPKTAVSANGRISGNERAGAKIPPPQINEYGIPDWRLERPEFEVIEISEGREVHYEVRGHLDAPVPPIRESKYLKKEQYLEIYRWMLLNRRMEQALENLYKQG